MFRKSLNLTDCFSRLKAEMSLTSIAAPVRPDPSLTVKLANSGSELTEVVEFLRETKGLFFETKVHNFLPTTSWIVLRKHGRIMGVASLAADSAMGLPIEQRMNLVVSRVKYSRLAQIGEFTMSSDMVLEPTDSLWLLKYVLIYATKMKKVDMLILDSRNPILRNFAVSIGLPMLQGEYVLERLSWKQSLQRYSSIPFPNNRNAMKEFLLSGAGDECFTFPEREFFCSNDPCLDPASFEKLFHSKQSIDKTLNEAQRMIIRNSYPTSIYGEALPKVENAPAWCDLRKIRSETHGQAFDMDAQKEVEIIRASETGLLLFTKPEQSARMPRSMNLKCHVGKGHFASLRGQIVSRIGQTLIGVEITKRDSNWTAMNEFAIKPFILLG